MQTIQLTTAARRLADHQVMSTLLLSAAMATAAAAPALYQAAYRGQIYPGVTVGGIALGGLRPSGALEALAGHGLDPAAPVVLHVADEVFTVDAKAAGLSFDARATVVEAYAIGRRGPRAAAWLNMLAARLRGQAVRPVVQFDRARTAAMLSAVASQFDRAAQDASVGIEGTSVRVVDPAPGRRLDRAAALSVLEGMAGRGTWPIEANLPVMPVPPTVADATEAVMAAQSLLSAPITLRAGDQTWVLEPAALGRLLSTEVRGDRVALTIHRERFTSWMATVSQEVSRTALAPRFHFDQSTGRLQLVRAGRSGQVVNMVATAERLLTAPQRSGRLVRIVVDTIPPPVDDTVTAADLGIRDLLWEETSRFVGSPAARVHNIALAASRFDGLLVPPDAVFSFNDNLGDISVEEGYEETKIIMDGATADGVGGGVCQVSTTLFRAAFWSGLPIVQRLAHGYRVSYYEQGNVPVGLDATVYSPDIDLKFRNDTGAWLLIETESNPAKATVTFRLYGTDPGRQVRMEGPVISSIEPPPPPTTIVDPELQPGASEKRELERSGATVRVTRIVVAGDEETREVFHSQYRPTGLVIAVGPDGDAQPPDEGTPPGE